MVHLLVLSKAAIGGREGSYVSLSTAAELGYCEIVEFLVEAKASFNPASNHINTLLFSAVICGDVSAVQTLLQNRANVNEQDQFKKPTPLHHAAAHGQDAIVKALIDAHAQIDALSDRYLQDSLLACAVNNGHSEVVRTLRNAKASLDDDILCKAVRGRNVTVVQMFLVVNATMAPDERKWSALDSAAFYGQSAIVQALIDAKITLNGETTPYSPLHRAVGPSGDMETLRVLIGVGADHELVRDKKTPLECAAHEHCSGAVHVLLEAKAAVDGNESRENTPLCSAMRGYAEAAAHVLVEAKANLDKPIEGGITALHMAASYCCSDANLRMPIDAKASLDVKDEYGLTPLHDADDGYPTKAQILLDARAHVAAEDLEGRTPLHKMIRRNRSDVIEILLGPFACNEKRE